MINPVDAEPRGIKTGDNVRVFNDRGALVIPAFGHRQRHPESRCACRRAHGTGPTRRASIRGGCFNVLTTLKPTPLAKGNPSHTNLVQVEKFRG